MINFTLYKRELRRSILTLVIFGAVMTLYISIIVSMYNPEMMQSLEEMRKMLPELMSAVGMKAGANSLLGFMSSYLYGFPSGSTHQAENDCHDADVGSFNGYFLFDHLWHCIRDPLRITI